VIVGAIKSAQLPFSSWLPRAMEGPTTSSAIFYGSLSVHIGLFLLLRISPLWMDVWSIRIVIIVLGISTSFVGNYIARVQSSIKTQIAYSSIAQIGLMFVETGLGLHTLVLFHFAGNAFLRTYQLLVSPSVLNYLIHDQYFHFEKPKDKIYSGFLGKFRTSIFLLSIKEWNLDTFQFRFLWSPFKTIGKSLQFLRHKLFYIIIGLFFLFGLSEVVSGFKLVQNNHESFVIVYALVGVVLILLAFTERAAAKRAWIFLVSSQLYFALAIAFNEQFELSQVLIYLSGDIVCAIVGYLCLNRIEKTEGKADLGQFYGHIYEHPRLGTAFLLSCLGLVGFPITPAFIGVDLLISHIHTDQLFLILIVAIGFIFMEIAALRMYSRIFLGQHVKQYHEIAFRNS
jgi:NADH:ubiquinone oxidoreductase subunit 5 (subunit L)/multisubunit Na+/H+ antiporter MnhA subunit